MVGLRVMLSPELLATLLMRQSCHTKSFQQKLTISFSGSLQLLDVSIFTAIQSASSGSPIRIRITMSVTCFEEFQSERNSWKWHMTAEKQLQNVFEVGNCLWEI